MVEGDGALRDGRFRVVRPLGAGGMGAVWLVEDRDRGELVALKRIHDPHPRAMRRFKREFRAIERLRHPGLVRPLELGEDPEGLYLLVEYVEGVDLDRWLFEARERAASRSGAVPGGRRRGETAWATTVDGSDGSLRMPASAEASVGTGHEEVAQGCAERARRLAPLVPPLLDALGALHAQGIVHRDLKPPNVLVEQGGRPRLLDFGVLAQLGRSRGHDLAGTPGYIAPECIDGAEPAPSADLYALGVMLFELLTGEHPLPADTPVALLARTLSDAPPRLCARWSDAPRPLEALVERLLSKSPVERPSLEELSERLPPLLAPDVRGGSRGVFPSLLPGARRWGRGRLRGRERELRWLRTRVEQVREGGFCAAWVRGRSGIGKSALCERLLRDVEREGGIVLRGRARLSERVPFGGLDEAMDDLAEHLGRLSPGDVHGDALASLQAHLSAWLPTLAPVRPPRSGGASRPFPSAGAALCELLRLVAALPGSRPLVLFVDDVQWLDGDAVHLLRAVVEQAPGGVMLLLAERTDTSAGVASAWLRGAALERLPLTSLSTEALRQIVLDVQGADAEEGADRLDAWLARCDGLPLLAEITALAAARGERLDHRGAPEAFVEQAISSVGAGARGLLAVLMAVDDWLAERHLAEAMGWSVGRVESTLRDLRALGLVRWSGEGLMRRRVRLYHDAVRVALDRLLSEPEQQDAHARLARWLGARSGASPIALVHHLVGAGLYEEAFRVAPDATREAERRRAWTLAARMAAVVLLDANLSQEERITWQVRRAEHLDRAGLYEEAARAWAGAASETRGSERQAALLGAAGALLAAGHVLEGRDRLAEATAGVRGRAGPLDRALAALRFLRGPRGVRRGALPDVSAEASDEFRLRMELEVRAGTMLGYFDPLEGLTWLQQAQQGFERAGAVEAAAWCDFVFAYMGYFGARRAGPVPLAERFRAAAEARGASSEHNPRLDAMPHFLRGLAAKREGRWSEAAEAMDEALGRLDAAGIEGSFEHALLLVHRAQVALFSEQVGELIEWLERLRDASRGRGASAVRCHLAMLELFTLELTGDPEALRRKARQVREAFREPAPLTFQGFLAVFYSEPLVGLLEEPERSLRLCRDALRAYRRFRPLQSMYAGNFAALLLRLQAVSTRARPSVGALRRARRLVALAREAPPFQTLAAERALARLEERRGLPTSRVVERLRLAEERAERLGQRVQWALCHHARGLRTSGREGEAMRHRAREALAALGVREDVLLREEGTS